MMPISDDLLDKLGTYFVHHSIDSRYGIPFEKFIEMHQSGIWTAYLAWKEVRDLNRKQRLRVCCNLLQLASTAQSEQLRRCFENQYMNTKSRLNEKQPITAPTP